MKASELIHELTKCVARCGDKEVEISVDVSTCENDAENRIFATPFEVMDGDPIMVLTEQGERNFSAPAQPYATPPRDVVEVPRDKLTAFVARFLELAETVGQIKELAKIDDRHLQDAKFRSSAQAQPATEREGT